MMGVTASERFSDPEFYGALNPDILCEKICEAEKSDVARLGKSDSKGLVEITFNHTEVNQRASD